MFMSAASEWNFIAHNVLAESVQSRQKFADWLPSGGVAHLHMWASEKCGSFTPLAIFVAEEHGDEVWKCGVNKQQSMLKQLIVHADRNTIRY